MPHLPFMQFYPADWLRDTRRLNPPTKGHWIDLLCAMWDSPTRGEIVWTLAAYGRHLGVSIETAVSVLVELLDTNTADGEFLNDVTGNCQVDCTSDHRGDEEDIRTGACFGFPTNCQEHVRLINRRMLNDEQVRKNNRDYQQKSRDKHKTLGNSKGTVRPTSGPIYQKSEVRSHIREEEDNTSPFLKKEAVKTWPSPTLLIELYNTLACDDYPAVLKLSKGRLRKASEYLKQFPDKTFWEEVIAELNRSSFLRGRVKSNNGHDSFRADFDWLLTKGKDGTENAVKTWEGKYRDGT